MTVVATPSSAASAGVDLDSPRRCARASDAISDKLKPSRTPPEGMLPTRSSIRQFGNAAATTAPSRTAIHDMYIHNRKIGMMASAPYTV